MKHVLSAAILIYTLGLLGCGPSTTTRSTATVDVTAKVNVADNKPLTKNHSIVLQPLGDTLGGKLTASVDGQFSGKVTPGKYTYYVTLANSEVPSKMVPPKYSEPNAEHVVEIPSNGGEIKIPLN